MGATLIVLIVVVLAALLVMLGISKRKSDAGADEVMERMGRFATREEFLAVSEGGGRRAPNKVAQSIEEAFKGRNVANNTAALITRADAKLTIGEFLLIRIVSAGAAFFLGFILMARFAPAFGVLVGIAFAVAGFLIPQIYLAMKARKRRKRFVGQLGDTITLMANSLRAGYSLLQTMEMVSRETADPMGVEFRRVVREVGLGISHSEAMENLLRRVPSEDLDLLVTAINI